MLGEQRLAATLLLSGGLCGSRGALTARAAASPGRRKLSCGPAASRSGRITSALLRRRPPPPRHETCPASQRSGVRSVAAGQGQSRGGAAGGCPLGLAPSPKERGAKAAPPRGRARRHRETPRWRPRAPRAAASQPAPCPGRKRPLQPASKPQGGGEGDPRVAGKHRERCGDLRVQPCAPRGCTQGVERSFVHGRRPQRDRRGAVQAQTRRGADRVSRGPARSRSWSRRACGPSPRTKGPGAAPPRAPRRRPRGPARRGGGTPSRTPRRPVRSAGTAPCAGRPRSAGRSRTLWGTSRRP